MDIENVKAKIQKLLALAGDSNSHEAQAALLAARRLMAKHKLSEKDLPNQKPELSMVLYQEATFTGIRNSWFPVLAKVIAKHHCCGVFAEGCSGSQTQNVGFVGLNDDPVLAKMMFHYACEHIMSWSERLRSDLGKGVAIRKLVKEYTLNYAIGFSEGLEQQYREQEDHGDPGMELMAVIPREVQEWKDSLKTVKLRSNGKCEYHPFARQLGYEAGHSFKPTRRLDCK